MKNALLYSSSVLATLILTACGESHGPPVSPSVQHSRSQAEVPLRGETLDEAFARHARAVPEFAGLWIDAGGRLTINVTAASSASRAAAELAPLIADIRKRSPGLAATTQFRVVAFDYDKLALWHQLLFSELGASLPMVSLDIDETNAQIEIGVSSVASASPVITSYLRGKGIPQEAVRIVSATPVPTASGASSVLTSAAITHQHLNLAFDPMPAGIVVAAQGEGLCTYGANVKYNGVPALITNTHCSFDPGTVDAVPYHQGGTIVGTELADPSFSICGSFACRYSDAVVVQLNGTKVGELGAIARTRFVDSYPPDGGVGDTIIDDARPRFQMHWPGYSSTPVMGEYVQKMGRRTGWIEGPINKTCFDWAGGDGWKRRCSYRFNGEVIEGDSGSPIFGKVVCPGETWPAVNCATWMGILWGKTEGQAYFSPTSGLFRDFPGSFEFTP